MAQFISRLMTYLANEMIVKGLANNPAFQRWAVKTNETMVSKADMATKMAESLRSSPEVVRMQQELKRGFKGFGESLRRQARDGGKRKY